MALATRLNAARKAVGDSGATQQVVRTHSRKGVRFVAEVTARGESSVSAAVSMPAVCGKPSIAVLPFTNVTGDPRQDHLADGIVEEITVALARFRWFLVAACGSSFAHKGKHRDVREAGRALGAGYALESVFSSSAIRLFAGRPELAIDHVETALRLSPRVRVAPSLGLIGMAHFLGGRFDEAVPALLLAIEEDPSYPQPYRYLAACYAHLGRLGEARAVIARLRAVGPSVIPDPSYLRQPKHHELYLSGVLRALSG